MREQTQLPDDCFRPASLSLNMSKHLRRWFSANLIIRSFIELVDCHYKTQEPPIHQGQLWSLDTLKGMLSSTIFVEYNDRIEDGYGARTGYDFLFDNARLGANETRELRPRIKLIIYQGTLYFEEELPIDHPLRIFPDLDRGWDFKRNERRPDDHDDFCSKQIRGASQSGVVPNDGPATNKGGQTGRNARNHRVLIIKTMLHRLAAPGTSLIENLAKALFWGFALNPAIWLFIAWATISDQHH